jgi:hypothetical protein
MLENNSDFRTYHECTASPLRAIAETVTTTQIKTKLLNKATHHERIARLDDNDVSAAEKFATQIDVTRGEHGADGAAALRFCRWGSTLPRDGGRLWTSTMSC